MVKLGMANVLFWLMLTVALVSAIPDSGHKHTHFIIHVPKHIHKHIHTHVKKIYIPTKKEEHHEHHHHHQHEEDDW